MAASWSTVCSCRPSVSIRCAADEVPMQRDLGGLIQIGRGSGQRRIFKIRKHFGSEMQTMPKLDDISGAALEPQEKSHPIIKPVETMSEGLEFTNSASPVDSEFSYISDGKLDKCYRLRTPRAAREFSLCVLYGALEMEVHPMTVLENRMSMKKDFIAKEIMEKYDHHPVKGGAIFSEEEVNIKKLEALDEAQAGLEGTVLTAHPFVIYNRFVLSLARRLISTTADRWILQDPIVKVIIPNSWKNVSSGRSIEICLLHMAIAEIEAIGTSPNIVIHEAVELAKRFCDAVAPRVINGCLGSYLRNHDVDKNASEITRELQRSLSASLLNGVCSNDYLESL